MVSRHADIYGSFIDINVLINDIATGGYLGTLTCSLLLQLYEDFFNNAMVT